MVIHLLPPFPWIEPCDGLLKIFLCCAGLQVMAPVGAGILLDERARCKRLTVCAKGAPDRAVTAVLVGSAQRASRAELCAFCGCRRTRSVVLLLCFASGLEVPQLRALSIAVGDSIAQARALLQPSCCTALTLLTPPALCRSR